MNQLLVLLLLSFATEREACAYADPGSGALIWQMVMAGVVGVTFYLRRIISYCRNRKGTKN